MDWKYERHYIYDEPVEYKGLQLYPATMKDYFEFHFCVDCFMVDKATSMIANKNNVEEIKKIISMNDLEYLVYATSENTPYVPMFVRLLEISMRKTRSEFDMRFLEFADKRICFSIDNQIYDDTDYQEIKKIITGYNMIDLPDLRMAKETRDKLEEAKRLKQKMNNVKMGSLEDQMICVLISTNLSMDDIYKLSIRKFSKILQRVDHKLHYQIYLSAEMSGMVTFKNKDFIKHWMSDLEVKDKYADVKMTTEELSNKINTNKT